SVGGKIFGPKLNFFNHGVEHSVSVERRAVENEACVCLCCELGLEPLNQLGLSDAGFTSHYNGLSNAIFHKVPVIRQQGQLLSAPNQKSSDSSLDCRTAPLSFNDAKQPQRDNIFLFVDAEILVGKHVRR